MNKFALGKDNSGWWDGAIGYEVYLRSFADSNADGIGDLQGLVSKLDYLAWLGVDLVWVSPFYPSPMADFGYDVSDYCDVDPIFGTLEDFGLPRCRSTQTWYAATDRSGSNHSSSEHEWFVDSRSSMDSDKRGFYHWRIRHKMVARLITGFPTLGVQHGHLMS